MSNHSLVQFREACSHYKPCDSVKISYRYSVESDLKISSEDWIGVFPERARSIEDCLSSSKVGELSAHRLCDGGLFKTGSVSIKCPKESGGAYRFWFVSLSSNTEEVIGKSDTFILCVDAEDYPSMSFGTMDTDQDILEALQSRASFESIGEGDMVVRSDVNDSFNLGSSFILVSEGSMGEFPGSECTVANNVPSEHDSKISVGVAAGMEEKCKGKDDGLNKQYDITSSKEVLSSMSMSEYVVCPIPNPDDSDIMSQNVPEESVCVVLSSCLSSSKEFMEENDTKRMVDSNVTGSEIMINCNTANTEIVDSSATSIEVNDSHFDSNTTSSELIDLNVDSSELSDAQLSEPVLVSLHIISPLPMTAPLGQEIVDMSISTVATHITQREARLLKTSSRDLVQKIRKLTEILEENRSGNEELSLTLNERDKKLQEQEERLLAQEERLLELEDLKKKNEDEVQRSRKELANFKKSSAAREKEIQKELHHLRKKLNKSEEDRKKTETIGKGFIVEKSQLEEKIKQLSREKMTAFDRASKLLSQLQESETKRAVEKSEKQVLQGKIDYLSSELFAFKKPQLPVSNGRKIIPPQTLEPKQKKRSEDIRRKNNPGKPVGVIPVDQLPSVTRTKAATTQDKKDDRHHLGRKDVGALSKAKVPDSRINRPNDFPVVKGRQNDKEIPLQVDTLTLPINGHERESHDNLKKDELVEATGGMDKELSEERIALHLGEENSTMVECPICMKQLCSRENDYGVQLHVEHCLRLSDLEEAKD